MENEKQTEQDSDPRVDLAVERTILAHERTQLAWVRTILGVITAGIAIDKGFAALHDARVLAGKEWAKNGHFAGMLLSITGTILIFLTLYYYNKRIAELFKMIERPRKILDPTLLLSLFTIIIGILAIYFLTIA